MAFSYNLSPAAGSAYPIPLAPFESSNNTAITALQQSVPTADLNNCRAPSFDSQNNLTLLLQLQPGLDHTNLNPAGENDQ